MENKEYIMTSLMNPNQIKLENKHMLINVSNDIKTIISEIKYLRTEIEQIKKQLEKLTKIEEPISTGWFY